MVYQILISYNMRNEISLDVANSLEEFGKTWIGRLKWEIADKIFGHHLFYIKLIFGNTLLEDNQTLGFYKIEHLSVLLAVLKMPCGGVYQVLVNYNDKNELLDVANSFEKFSNITILMLKEKFRRKFPGAPYPKRLRMIFGNSLLEDDQTLRFYKITHLSVLLVVMRMPGGGEREDTVYQVRIRLHKNMNEVLTVANSLEEFENTTIRELKERWFALNSIASEVKVTASSIPRETSVPEDFKMIFGCNELEDVQTFGFHGIEHLSVLYIIQRMPGGGAGGVIFPLEEVIPRTESMERLSYSM